MPDSPEKFFSLIQSLHHPNRAVIRNAADSLANIARERPQLVPELEKHLATCPKEKRWPIAYVLARLPNPSSLCIQVLVENLGSEDRDIRWAAARLLITISQKHHDIQGTLQKVAHEGNVLQKRMSLYCLREIDPDSAATLRVLMDALKNQDALTRIAAVTSIGCRKNASKETVDALLRIFSNDSDMRVRCAVAFAIAEISPPTERVYRAFKETRVEGKPQLQKAIDAALKVLQKKEPGHA